MIYNALHIYLHVTYEWVGLTLVFINYVAVFQRHLSVGGVRCSGACDSCWSFISRGLLIPWQPLNQGFLLVKLKSSFWRFYGRNHGLVYRYGISVSQVATDVFRVLWARPGYFPIGELSPDLLMYWFDGCCWWGGAACRSGAPGFASGFWWGRVARSLVLSVFFVDRCLSFCNVCPFFIGHFVVCSSSIYGCWLPHCYLQTLLTYI